MFYSFFLNTFSVWDDSILVCINRNTITLQISLLNSFRQPLPNKECLLIHPISQENLSCLNKQFQEEKIVIMSMYSPLKYQLPHPKPIRNLSKNFQTAFFFLSQHVYLKESFMSLFVCSNKHHIICWGQVLTSFLHFVSWLWNLK